MNIVDAVSLRFTVVGNGRYRRTREHDSLVIDTARNTFFWNSRGFGGDVKLFLTKVLGISKDIANFYAEPAKNYEVKKNPLNQNLAEIFWKFGKNRREFWYKRGFTDQVIDLYKLGFYGDSYTIPFIMNGVVKAIALRKEPKYISEIEGSDKSLFGYDQLDSEKIILVESPLDVPLLRRFNYNAVSFTYGVNSWEQSWNELFTDFNVVVIPDNDKAGSLILKKLTFYCKVAQWPRSTPKGFDVGKLFQNNKERFVNNLEYLVDTSVPINFLWQENVV